jgi:uncharacterized membrane protein (DUF373 family)
VNDRRKTLSKVLNAKIFLELNDTVIDFIRKKLFKFPLVLIFLNQNV